MNKQSSHEKMVQDCQAAILRIRQAIIDGNANTPELQEDWEFIRRALRHYLTLTATIEDRRMPGAGEEMQQIAYDRLCDHIQSLTYHSLTKQFGSYLKHAKKRALGIIRQRTSCIARLDLAQNEGSCLADHTCDPRAELALESVVNRLALENALAQLDCPDRQIIMLLQNDYTYEEIARHFGIAPSTVARRIKRVGTRLRSILSVADW
jgi:RNA polymerase sigma factor (sigma-70 family)